MARTTSPSLLASEGAKLTVDLRPVVDAVRDLSVGLSLVSDVEPYLRRLTGERIPDGRTGAGVRSEDVWALYVTDEVVSDAGKARLVLAAMEDIIAIPRFPTDQLRSRLAESGWGLDAVGRLIEARTTETSGAGSLINERYRTTGDLLGDGGLGIVFKVEDHHRRSDEAQYLALKRLRTTLRGEFELVERFRREAQEATQLYHDNILRVLDSGDDADGPWHVTEIAEGGTLRAKVTASRQLPPREILEVARSVASALSYIHQRELFHRDLSPGNILRKSGRWVVSDFGLCSSSKSTPGFSTTYAPGRGTDHYAAPEQLADLKAADSRSDVYSFGKVLQFAAEGVEPVGPPAPGLPHAEVCLRATQLDPDARFSSADELLIALEEAFADHVGQTESARLNQLQAAIEADAADDTEARQLIEWLSELPDAGNFDAEAAYSDATKNWLTFTNAPPGLLRSMARTPEAFEAAVIAAADDLADGIYPFARVDAISAGLRRMDLALPRPGSRRAVIRAIARLSERHHRFAARRMVLAMLKSVPPEPLFRATVDGLFESATLGWIFQEASVSEVHRRFAEAIEARRASS